MGGRVRDYLKQNPAAINYLMPLLSGAMGGKLNLKAMMGNRPQASGASKEGDVFGLG